MWCWESDCIQVVVAHLDHLIESEHTCIMICEMFLHQAARAALESSVQSYYVGVLRICDSLGDVSDSINENLH